MELDELDRVLGVMVADQRPVDVISGLELVRRRHRRRQMRQFGTAAAVVMIVAVGAVVIGRSGSPSIQVSTGPGTASAASTSSGCVDRPPPPGVPAASDNVFPLTGPATTALTGGAVHDPLTLDDGTFRVDRPLAGDKPAVDLVHAECAALSGVSARGYSINYAARSNGYVIGYGRVTIRTGLTSHQPVIAIPDRPHPEGDTLVVAPTLPAAQPVYQGRLAWVVVVDDFATYSCPHESDVPAAWFATTRIGVSGDRDRCRDRRRRAHLHADRVRTVRVDPGRAIRGHPRPAGLCALEPATTSRRRSQCHHRSPSAAMRQLLRPDPGPDHRVGPSGRVSTLRPGVRSGPNRATHTAPDRWANHAATHCASRPGWWLLRRHTFLIRLVAPPVAGIRRRSGGPNITSSGWLGPTRLRTGRSAYRRIRYV